MQIKIVYLSLELLVFFFWGGGGVNAGCPDPHAAQHQIATQGCQKEFQRFEAATVGVQITAWTCDSGHGVTWGEFVS